MRMFWSQEVVDLCDNLCLELLSTSNMGHQKMRNLTRGEDTYVGLPLHRVMCYHVLWCVCVCTTDAPVLL